MGDNQDTWLAGQTWVFQGTVAEDATAGTHICTLTVTPGAGNEMKLLFAECLEGNTATAQTTNIKITDGTNLLARWVFAQDTAANIFHDIPVVTIPAANTSNGMSGSMGDVIISGTQQLILQIATAAVSVTQTFAVVCRLKTGQIPTAVLADSVGTPTLTINTNKVF